MITVIAFAVPMTALWMILSDQYSLVSFGIGYVISMGILVLSNTQRIKIDPTRIPTQLFWSGVYLLVLGRDIIISAVQVTRIVLTPGEMPIKPGIIPVATLDPKNDRLITALSAHAITITPGEMVVDFEATEDNQTLMYVHCLDVDEARETLVRDQQRRLGLMKRIFGQDA